MASIKQRPDGTWRARYRGADGREYAKHFKYKNGSKSEPELGSAQQWLDEATAALQAGTWVDPRTSKLTMGEWLDSWILGYATNKPSTVAQARVHVKRIREEFGERQLRSIRPSDVKAWTVTLSDKYAVSTVYALHRRLSQVLADAVHDGILTRNPCSRRTSPPAPSQRAYVATAEQVWALHDTLPAGYKNMVLLGGFVGLRIAEMAALEIRDVDFDTGIVSPERQYPDEPLKSETSRTPVPIPLELGRMLRENAGERFIIPGTFGRGISPYQLGRTFIEAREKIVGLPEGFRVHDLRHFFASLLIASGLDIKTVQARMRHASATVTLNTYGHLWPDKDESSREAVARALMTRQSPPSADSEGSLKDSAD